VFQVPLLNKYREFRRQYSILFLILDKDPVYRLLPGLAQYPRCSLYVSLINTMEREETHDK